MRIRKHASKILGTVSSHYQHSSQPPETAYAAFWVKQAYSCEVNRSMWDVFPFAPLGEDSDKEEEMQDKDDGDEIKEEAEAAMSAITSHTTYTSSSNTAELKMKEEDESAAITDHESKEEDYIQEGKNPKVKSNKANKGRKTATTTTTTILRTTARKEESKYIQSSTYTCKKTDGKQWRCKMAVDQPNSLCDYHLEQLLSYRCTSNTTRKARRPAPARKTATASSRSRPRHKRPRTPAVESTGSGSMYYYSEFGPWRGKQRGGEHVSVSPSVKEESEEGQPECYRSSRNDDDDDDSEEDSSEEEDSEEENREKLNIRKKKRRPVKARSLKSLL